MVLWTKQWYYTDNYGTSIYEGKKKHGKLPKTKKPLYTNYGNTMVKLW